MSVLETTLTESPAPAPTLSVLPRLSDVPSLLEYRAESDPDGEFIPKTIAGFGGGALAMFITLDLGVAVVQHGLALGNQALDLAYHFAFMLGITFVAASLLLVGLKVRADHHEDPLFARHWLNSIGTGAAYAAITWTPWLLWTYQHFLINRFVAAVLFMLVMAFPVVAARWTIGPHAAYARKPGQAPLAPQP